MNNAPGSKKNPLFPKMMDAAVLRDAALLLGWIAGLILIVGLCWFFTQPLRSRLLLRAVNRVLLESGDSRRLEELPQNGTLKREPGISAIGSWYNVSGISPSGHSPGESAPEEAKAVVFTFIGEGSFFPCAAIVGSGGEVQEFIALTSHGKRLIKQVSPGILRIYSNRISSGRSVSARRISGRIGGAEL